MKVMIVRAHCSNCQTEFTSGYSTSGVYKGDLPMVVDASELRDTDDPHQCGECLAGTVLFELEPVIDLSRWVTDWELR